MADDSFDQIIRKATDLEKSVRRPLKKMKVSSEDKSVELEWDADGQAHPAGSAEPATAAAAPTAEDPETSGSEDGDSSHFHITSPLVGTFYQAPEPGARPFVSPGDVVEPGQQVAIIEAMKLMNPVEADRSGQVTEILAPDKSAVEYGQPLIALAPIASDQRAEAQDGHDGPEPHAGPEEPRDGGAS
jgi:acetyl-CoA carboxylase biotin carboxyl carrier protein